jgi:sulfonate transport system substrate-binding protein
LTVADVTPVYLAPADARAAFERGSVDAWAIWDPFLAAAQEQLHVRLLATGDGAVSNHQFYLATRAFAVQHPDLLRIVTEEIAAVDRWGEEHPDQVAHALAPLTGLDESTLAIAAARSSYGVAPLTERVLVQQQQIADAFFDLKLIPHAILVRDATLAPAS